MTRLIFLIPALMAFSACNSAPGDEQAPNTQQIENLSKIEEEPKADPRESVRLQSLASEDLLLGSDGGCRFTAQRGILLATAGEGAVARLGDELRTLIPTGPAGPSGGFYEQGQMSISVGRGEGATPDRLAVTNRRTGAHVVERGAWECGSP